MCRFLLAALLLLSACAQLGADKYPFSPQFVSPDAICPCTLGAPPATGSATQMNELASILAKQRSMSAAEKAAVKAEDHITPGMMLDPVLGKGYSLATHPALFTLMGHAASDAWRIADSAQDHWNRTRPWITDSRVKLLVSSITRPSYPSGHSTTNHIWAHVLSELFPKKRDALFKRAYAIGMHRVAAGVHYPSDVLAGKRLAAAIYEKMSKSPEFQRELAAARAELASPVAANDNAPLPHGSAAECTTPAPGASMVMCR